MAGTEPHANGRHPNGRTRTLPHALIEICPHCGTADPTTGGTLCGAHKKSQADDGTEHCSKPAGNATDHPGTGRCSTHGGKTPIKHGRYSTVHHERVRDLYEQHKQSDDPLNLFDEMALARALLQDFIERHEVYTEALLAWYESYQVTRSPLSQEKIHALGNVVDEWENEVKQLDPAFVSIAQKADIETARAFIDLLRGGKTAQTPRPARVLDIADAHRLIDTISKVAERIEKARAGNAISRNDFRRLTEQMGLEVMKVVTDEGQLRRIRDGFMSIRL